MTSVAPVPGLIAELLEYPAAGYRQRLAEVIETLPRTDERVANLLGKFANAVSERSLKEMEELYVQTFDLNPDASLEIGWHLFGEDYARGEFLVKLRQEMRRHGIPDRDELPDSLLSVLPLLARMPEEEAAHFRTGFLLPAIEKLRKAVPESNPFADLLSALILLLPGEGAECEPAKGDS
jgi:nitrate reductase delta subunit